MLTSNLPAYDKAHRQLFHDYLVYDILFIFIFYEALVNFFECSNPRGWDPRTGLPGHAGSPYITGRGPLK